MKKILVIEDDLSLREFMMKYFLEKEGYFVITAEDGEVGVEKAKLEIPDLILCDVLMPKMNGYDVIKILKAYKPTAKIPFVYLTAMIDPSNVREGMELGADDYLFLPFESHKVLSAIAKQFEKYKETENWEYFYYYRYGHSYEFILNKLFAPILSYTDLMQIISEDDIKNSHVVALDVVDDLLESASHLRFETKKLKHRLDNYICLRELEVIALQPKQIALWRTYKTREGILSSITEHFGEGFIDPDRINDVSIKVVDSQVAIDPDHFRKIIKEIADNTFRFSPPGTPIMVTGFIEGLSYRLSVENKSYDTIPQGEITEFGNPFSSGLRDKMSQPYGWDGRLGLGVVHKFLYIYGGSMTIESNKEEGTTVTLRLPLAPSA